MVRQTLEPEESYFRHSSVLQTFVMMYVAEPAINRYPGGLYRHLSFVLESDKLYHGVTAAWSPSRYGQPPAGVILLAVTVCVYPYPRGYKIRAHSKLRAVQFL